MLGHAAFMDLEIRSYAFQSKTISRLDSLLSIIDSHSMRIALILHVSCMRKVCPGLSESGKNVVRDVLQADGAPDMGTGLVFTAWLWALSMRCWARQ